MTSPPVMLETAVFASSVPAEKSATVVSVRVTMGAAVVKLQVASAPSGLPEKSLTDAATSLPAPLARSRKVEELKVEPFISSLNVTVTSLPIETPVALGAGERLTIVGGVVSDLSLIHIS